MNEPLRHFDTDALKALAQAAIAAPPCDTCAPLRQPGWESMPGSYDRSLLEPVGTLREPQADGAEEPTLQEYHPNGTHAWSPDAPIAPGYYPYNRCDVWRCVRCRRPYLRYTEYGGYYVDERIRPLDPARVVTPA